MRVIRTEDGWFTKENDTIVNSSSGDEELPVMSSIGNGLYWCTTEEGIELFSFVAWTGISLSISLLDFCNRFHTAAVKTTGGSCACNGVFENIHVHGYYSPIEEVPLFTLIWEDTKYTLSGELLDLLLRIRRGVEI